MSDRTKAMDNTAQALLLLSAALRALAELSGAASAIGRAIEKARAENRDITDAELEAARAESTLADLRFQQAVEAFKD